MSDPELSDELSYPVWAIGLFWLAFLLCIAGWLLIAVLTPRWPESVTIPLVYLGFPGAWAFVVYLFFRNGKVQDAYIQLTILTFLPFIVLGNLGYKEVKAKYLVNLGIVFLILGILPVGFMWLLGAMEGLPLICFTDPGFCFR